MYEVVDEKFILARGRSTIGGKEILMIGKNNRGGERDKEILELSARSWLS